MKHNFLWLRKVFYFILAVQFIVLLLSSATPVYADDCAWDPLNAADCMRTPGFRQGISVIMSVGGAATTVLVSVLSGGAQTVVQPGDALVSDQKEPEPSEPDQPEDLPEDKEEMQPPEEQEPDVSDDKDAQVPDEKDDQGQSDPNSEDKQEPDQEPPEEQGETDQDKVEKPDETPEDAPEKQDDPSSQPAPDPSTAEQVFILVKDLVGATGNIVGGFNEYATIADSPEKIKAIRDALEIWRKSPSSEAAQAYLDNLRKSNGLRANRLGDKLGMLSKGLDVVEALNKAVKVCNERGYTGSDALMRAAAELGKKGLGWMLTKNPIVGLADAAVGGATQMIFGAENKIDIGSTIDKTADAWDDFTQEAADLYYGNSVADADAARLDNLNRYLKRIRQQVNDGVISREEGSKRMRRLVKIMS
jgi:hypothetical protein